MGAHDSGTEDAYGNSGAHVRGENGIQVLGVHDAHVDACSCFTASVCNPATVHRLLHAQLQLLRERPLPLRHGSQTASTSMDPLQG